MNEIDLYVSLIDEEEANEILKFFNKTVKTGNLEFKKTRIKTIFRGQQQVKKISSSGPNPFLVILKKYQIERFNEYEEKEFLMELNSESNDISDSQKLANLIIKLPNKVNEYLKIITDNINSGKYLFDFGMMFNDESEIINYFTKTAYMSNGKEVISFINKYYDIAINNELIYPMDKPEIEIIKKYSIQELYNRIQGEDAENIFKIKYVYINTHTEIEKDLFIGLCGDILIDLVNLFYKSERKDNNKKITSDIEIKTSMEKKLKNLIEENKNINKEYIAFVRKSQKEIRLRNEELEELKNKIETLKSESIEINNLTKQIKKLDNKNKELENKYKEERNKNKDNEKKIRETNIYYEYAFKLNELSEEKRIGIIHSMEYISIAKIIFNEVAFITLSNWKEQVNKLEAVYIQREGISTRKLEEIKNYCSKRGIANKVISIDNEKTLIENISLIKANGRKI